MSRSSIIFERIILTKDKTVDSIYNDEVSLMRMKEPTKGFCF